MIELSPDIHFLEKETVDGVTSGKDLVASPFVNIRELCIMPVINL